MSKLPLDIVNFNTEFNSELDNAITIANGIQSEFLFAKVPGEISRKFQFLNFEEIDSEEFLPKAFETKKALKGFYPYISFYTNSPLKGNGWTNLFADSDLENGISVVTTHNVATAIIPKEKMTSYFLYYFARGILKFIIKDKFNHDAPSKNGCLFDFMQQKKTYLKVCDQMQSVTIVGVK